MNRELKTFKFEVKEIDEEEGTFTGYAATFSKTPDSYGDVIDPGAFKKTIKERVKQIKILWNHNTYEPIGRPTELSEDETGLLFKGKLSLGVQRAREILSLMRDGVINEMSIGYNPVKEKMVDGVRHLQELKLYDVSPVSFAANPEATITGVKKATSFGNLPLADRDKVWDASACERRVRAWAGGEDNINWNKYQQAFFWYNQEDSELFGSYKLGFADVIGGRLTAIPKGIFAVAGVLMGARGGVDIPAAEGGAVKGHVEKYYAKMRKEFDDEDIIAPWKKSAEELENTEAEELEPAEKQVNVGNLVVTVDVKTGRVLSGVALENVQEALDALQALLDAAKNEPEPTKATQLEEVAGEAAKLEGVVAALKAENEGFDVGEAERRIESILDQIRK